MTVNNQVGGNIIGDNEGILLEGTTITIDIGPSNLNDVAVAASNNTITNAGTISGSDAGITIGANAADNTVTNDGTFTGSRGFDSESGGTLTNNGTITGTGNEGIRFTGNDDATVTLGNSSTTEGDGDAINFGGTGTNTLNIVAGATVDGDIQGSAGTDDSLNLSGSGDGGTLQVQDFETLTADGGDFTLGSDTTGFAQGATINAGNITLLGTISGDADVASGATLTLSGTGMVGGTLTNTDGGTLEAAGNSVGTLTTGGLMLSSGSIINVDLGDPDDATTSDKIQVNGDLTLDGTLNARDAGDFGVGVYRIIDYTGALTDNGLLVGTLPTGFTTDQTEVQTSVSNQVNLIVAANIPDIQFWDGTDTVADSAVDGGAGSWNLTDTNWTNAAGDANAAWNSKFAVFSGAAGSVTVDDAITFTGLQFITDGYTIAPGSGALTISEAETNVRVDPGVTATISAPIGGAGGINQLDSGTLILTGTNTYTGNTAVGGTLVLNGSIAGAASVASDATLSGTGTVGGAATIADGGILAAGDNGVGTLTTGGLVLSAGSIINVDLGDPDDASTSDKIQVNGDLTLDGTLNASDAGDFGIGVYRIIDYTGALTDNGLLVGTLPTGFINDQAEVQTSVGNQVNLIISGVAPNIQFWDGADTTADAAIDGGTSSWNLTDTNWTNGPGDENTAWNSLFAVFAGSAGSVTVDDAITFTGLQFTTDGYTIAPGSGGLTISEAETNVRVDPDVTATISAPIGGTGGINQLDSGTLILTGANTYTGNTAVGGTLVLNGSIAGAASVASGATLSGTGTVGGAATIADGGILAAGDNGVGTLTMGGLVLSAGSIINADLGDPDDATTSDKIQVNGDLTLDGTLNASDAGDFGIGVYRIIDYTGALTDNGLLVGTLPAGFTTDQTEVQTSVGNQVNLIVAANIPDIQFWDGADTAADSAVDGGAGSWNLTDTNWTNAAGDANAAWNSKFAVFGGAAGSVTVDDAITFTGLQFTTDGYTIAPGSGALTISEAETNVRVDPGVTATISAPIGGTGGLNQLDSGTLILTGTNTYTGNTAVGGTLVLNGSIVSATTVTADGTVGGTGQFGDLTIAGTIAPGVDNIGTLNVAGDIGFAAGSQYNVEVLPDGSTDLIAATGEAAINGGIVNVLAGGTVYDLSTDYTILTVGGGVDGTFDSVNSNLAFLTPTLSYEANSVLLNLARNDVAFADIGQTANQMAAGAAIQSQGSSALGNQIVNLDAASARGAFDQLSGELHPTVRTVMTEDNRLVRNAIMDHLTENDGRTIWGDIWGSTGDSDGDSNAAGLSRDSYGLLMGADVSIGEGSYMGIAGSYSGTDIDLGNRASSGASNLDSATVKTFNVVAYLGVDLGGVNFRAGGGYGWSDVETDRAVAFNTFTASYSGSTLFGFSEFGYRFDVGSGYAEPYLGGTFIEANTDEFAESGGDAALRAVGEIENSLISTVGVRFGTSEKSTFRLRGKAGWQHGFGDLTPSSTARFATGSNFTTAGAPQSGDAGFIQLEGVYKLSEIAEIGISYDGIYGDASQDHAAVARITIGF